MCLQNPNATFNDCNEFISNNIEETYFEYEMCVWDFKTETIKTRFLVAKTICGFILPLIIISISYFIIGIRKFCFNWTHVTLKWPFLTHSQPRYDLWMTPHGRFYSKMTLDDWVKDISASKMGKMTVTDNNVTNSGKNGRTNGIILCFVIFFFLAWMLNHG